MKLRIIKDPIGSISKNMATGKGQEFLEEQVNLFFLIEIHSTLGWTATTRRHLRRSGVFIVNFEHISQLFLNINKY